MGLHGINRGSIDAIGDIEDPLMPLRPCPIHVTLLSMSPHNE